MATKNRNWLGEETGNVLVLTLLVLFAISAIGSTLAVIASMDLKISGNQRITTAAIDVAEAGLNEALHRLSVVNPTTTTVGGWTGNIAISDPPPLDPLWEARIYLTSPGSAPASAGSVYSTGTIQDPNADYMPYSRASGTEGVLTIRHKWVDRNADNVRDPDEVVRYNPQLIPPENFTSGLPVEIVTVSGRRVNATRTIEVETTKRTVVARSLGALFTDRPVGIGGSPSFCGHNHELATPVGARPMGCFSRHLATGNLPGVTSTGDEVDIQGASVDVFGDPTPVDTSSTNPWYSFADALGLSAAEATQVLANADHTAITNPMNGITYIQGDVNINANTVGWGLLYVTGDAVINGGFAYKGLIYVQGDLTFTGTAWILGSVMVNGQTDFGFSAGTATVLYSEEAIRNFVGLAMPMIVLSWKELEG